ncbi:hypothetical protein FXO38_03327 [Capsicum annuum]|uniref:uncharacterized protein LOC107848449 n=1 Tax=Capsicum annuum TaxID=4072 RepID=UPI0007BF08EF|nr:uncharacterized protein LOC107848449 [Capsicum annuum]KAF3678295.1 hypothetical protein FXO38_03327 [Capsicum annuum]
MKNRGKSIEHKIPDFNYSISSDTPCIKHPNSSPIGICSSCLNDKLLNLIYSDDTYNIHSCSGDAGSIGRISFLLENEKQSKTEQVILLRSSSNSVEIKKNRNGFWKIKRLLFKKYREKDDDKTETSDKVIEGVSRSRSLCSFRGGDDGNSDYRFSSAKISDVTGGLLFDYVDHPVVEPRKSENGGDFKSMRRKFANSESVCCSVSSKMLPVVQKGNTLRASNTHLNTFLKSPSNVNVNSDKGMFGNNVDQDEDDFKNTRKKFTPSESICCPDSPNIFPIIQKGTTHSATFLKSPSNVNLDKGMFFPIKGSDFGNNMDHDDGDFKNLRKEFPNYETVCCSDSPNMLPILQKGTAHNKHSATFSKSPSNINSDRGIFSPIKGTDFGNTKDLYSVCCSDSPNMLSHSSQILKKRASSHSTSFLKSPSNTINSDRGIFDDDDSAFIDLKLDLLSSSSSRTSLSEPKLQLFSESMGKLRGGSCRMNEYDTRMKEGNSGKGNKVWKWISRKKTSTSKRDEINSNLIIKS